MVNQKLLCRDKAPVGSSLHSDVLHGFFLRGYNHSQALFSNVGHPVLMYSTRIIGEALNALLKIPL